jgi:hypothetical protein
MSGFLQTRSDFGGFQSLKEITIFDCFSSSQPLYKQAQMINSGSLDKPLLKVITTLSITASFGTIHQMYWFIQGFLPKSVVIWHRAK